VQFGEDMDHQIQPPGVDRFVEGALFDAVRRPDDLPGHIVIIEKLKQFLAGTVFLEMKKYQCGEFLFKRQFQRLVSS